MVGTWQHSSISRHMFAVYTIYLQCIPYIYIYIYSVYHIFTVYTIYIYIQRIPYIYSVYHTYIYIHSAYHIFNYSVYQPKSWWITVNSFGVVYCLPPIPSNNFCAFRGTGLNLCRRCGYAIGEIDSWYLLIPVLSWNTGWFNFTGFPVHIGWYWIMRIPSWYHG